MEEDFTIKKWTKKVEKSESTKKALEKLAECSLFIFKKNLMLQRTSRRMISELWKAKKELIEGSVNGEMTMV